MKKLLAHRLTLVLEILVTLAVCGVLVLFSFRQLHREALYFNSSVNRDYTYIMDGYTTAFDILCLHLDDKIRENPSLEEMQTWLYGQASTFRKAVGYNIFDDFYFTYKGGFVHSWPHGDYSQYVPSSRGWYQAAQKADGASVVIPPYKSFIGTTVITSIAKKYADDIYVGMDLKSQSLSNLLLERGFTNHSSRWLLLANAKGDVISANRPQLLKHNLFKNDDLITSSFSEALRSAQLRQLYPASATIAGSSMLVYAFPNDNGNLVCFLVPVADYFQEHLAPILFLALLLIVLEVAINIISRRRLLEESVVANTKDDFLSRMSHDIRTPLNGVIGMTQLAREANSSPVVGDYLRKIDISSHYLLGLVNDILDLSKINAGKMELHPEPYKETDFLQYLDSIILPMCAAKHQHFTAENYHWKHDVLVDKLKYNQIYFNLLSNAVKYTPEGGHIHMLTRNVRYEDGYMVFDSIISDDGIGMSGSFRTRCSLPLSRRTPAGTDGSRAAV
jgi:signal transduction histidine kinase